MKILIVEDDADLLDFLCTNLPSRGFAVDCAKTGAAGLRLIRNNDYDLFVFDLNLPDMKGETLVKEVKGKTHTPILILTVISSSETKVRLLNSGADDYLSKPFSFEEFVARLRVLLRRPHTDATNIFSVNDLTIDVDNHTVRRGKFEITLTRKEFDILEYLLRHRGKTISKSTLIDHVWDSKVNLLTSSVETHVANLRKKLGSADLVQTVHGRGYIIK